jgi:hypothetical protein
MILLLQLDLLNASELLFLLVNGEENYKAVNKMPQSQLMNTPNVFIGLSSKLEIMVQELKVLKFMNSPKAYDQKLPK